MLRNSLSPMGLARFSNEVTIIERLKFLKDEESLLGYDSQFVFEEDGHCIPSCKDKIIIVLLGEMTLYELIWSFANDLYFVGLPTTPLWADGVLYSPIDFINHDIFHAMGRRVLMSESYIFGGEEKHAKKLEKKEKENENIKKCLRYIVNQPIKIKDAVLFCLFLAIHEAGFTAYNLTSSINAQFTYLGYDRLYLRLQNSMDLLGFLPSGLIGEYDTENPNRDNPVLKAWMREQELIFIETWNAALAEEEVNYANEVLNANTVARYDARTRANAAAWDARNHVNVEAEGNERYFGGRSTRKSNYSRKRRTTRKR